MDQNINVQIKDLKKLIQKDQAEIDKTVASIKRFQEKKKNLDSKMKDNLHLLEELTNKKIVQSVSDTIGEVDDAKLAMLTDFLKKHSEEMTVRKKE